MPAVNPIQHNRSRRSANAEIDYIIQPIVKAAGTVRRTGRFDLYVFLQRIYCVHRDWTYRRVARRSARLIADTLAIKQRKGITPFRILIEATVPTANNKQKSRWVRALEYITSEDVLAKDFRKFISANGGLAGCAQLAAKANRKRSRPGGDWDV
jgi:hypothetical protein